MTLLKLSCEHIKTLLNLSCEQMKTLLNLVCEHIKTFMFILSLQLLLASCSPENRMHLSCLYLFIFALFSPIHLSSACNRCLTHTHNCLGWSPNCKFLQICPHCKSNPNCTGERGLCFVLSSNWPMMLTEIMTLGSVPHYLETSVLSRTNLRSSTMATVMKKLL